MRSLLSGVQWCMKKRMRPGHLLGDSVYFTALTRDVSPWPRLKALAIDIILNIL